MLESAQNWNLRLSNITKVFNTLTITDQKKTYNFCYQSIFCHMLRFWNVIVHAVLVDFYITLTYSLTIGKNDKRVNQTSTMFMTSQKTSKTPPWDQKTWNFHTSWVHLLLFQRDSQLILNEVSPDRIEILIQFLTLSFPVLPKGKPVSLVLP